jgi:hypothetical protein
MTTMNSLDINNASHPYRQSAINIIQDVFEPLLGDGIQGELLAGEKYYQVEDAIVDTIQNTLGDAFPLSFEVVQRANIAHSLVLEMTLRLAPLKGMTSLADEEWLKRAQDYLTFYAKTSGSTED